MVSSCSGTPPPRPGTEGCLPTLRDEIANLRDDTADAVADDLETLAQAQTAAEAHRAIVDVLSRYARVRRRHRQAPVQPALRDSLSVHCQIKTALEEADGLGGDAIGVLRYWTTPTVRARDCTYAAYHRALRHLDDLLLFAMARGDVSHTKDLEMQREAVELVHGYVLRHQLCVQDAAARARR